jgi:hypothetical protein
MASLVHGSPLYWRTTECSTDTPIMLHATSANKFVVGHTFQGFFWSLEKASIYVINKTLVGW